ncbi:MAG: universal stress protein [Rhodospirillaceae bacterium]|nr:universal stress protein [Rhodospirillaceae bacterium]
MTFQFMAHMAKRNLTKMKDILVHLDDSEVCSHRIRTAISLATKHDAHVHGIALKIKSTISAYIGEALPKGFKEAQRKAVEESARKAIEIFEVAANEAGISFDTGTIEKSAAKAPGALAFHARHSDLTILGQTDNDKEGASFNTALMEAALFESGRPIYLVPYVGKKIQPVKTAVVAWDGGAKAARSVNDSIPLLQDREEVIILVINAEDRQGAHGKDPGADIAAHLAQYGINARIERETVRDIDVDKAILNFLAESGADLLVMGAYGHSRLREKAFGGVTQNILKEMTAPVLMSN